MAHEHFIISTLNLPDNKIKDIQVLKINGVFHFKITLTKENTPCPFCGGKTSIKEYKLRSYHHLPFAGIPSVIDWNRRRFICKDCGKTFSESNPFGPENFLQSYAVLDSIAKALHSLHATYKDIADQFHVSIPLVQLYADSFLIAPRFSLPVNLGIDEIHSSMAKYGGSYLCIFVDNEKRVLNDILPDRSKRTLSRYLDSIPKTERDRVLFVTLDIWEPYRDIAHRYFKNAEVAVDPFHIIEHLTLAFTRIRIDIMNQSVYQSPAYYLLKKWYKLLESDSYSLDNDPRYNPFFKQKLNYRDLYTMLLTLNPSLTQAYELKEEYRLFNQSCSFDNAPHRLDEIILHFEQANLYCYTEFISLLKHWRIEIIHSFHRPYENRRLSNALAESLNEKIRELLVVSHGFSNFERFRARALYCLNPALFYSLTPLLSSRRQEGKKRGHYRKKNSSLPTDDFSDPQ